MIRLALCLIGLLMLSGCACKADPNFGFYYCGPIIVP